MVIDKTKQEIIESDARFIDVWAGPGSGKTFLVAQKIRNIYENTNPLMSSKIVCLTFTNKACRELRRKIVETLSGDYPCPLTTTFHKYALKLDKSDECKETDNESLDLTHKDDKDIYNKILEEATKYLNNNRMIQGIDYLFLDEAQDMNQDIYEFIMALMKANNSSNNGSGLKVMVLSDSDQAIFGYNEADSGYIHDLMNYDPFIDEEDKPRDDTAEFFLMGNYRSCEAIIEKTENYRKCYPENFRVRERGINSKAGIDNGVIRCFKTDNYCSAIANSIISDINPNSDDPISIGVIVPYNDDVQTLLYTLRSSFSNLRQNIRIYSTGNRKEKGRNPYNTFSLTQLDEFHALIKYLRIAQNVYLKSYRWYDRCIYFDNINSPEPYLCTYNGKKCYEARNKCINARNNFNFIKCMNRFSSAYENSKYYSAVCEFVDDYIKESGNRKTFDVDDFINWVSLFGFDDFYQEYVDKSQIDGALIRIIVSTIHKAKGMEFDSVYMACPSDVNLSDIEKCRYVAMTRAKKNLYIFNDKEEIGYCDNAKAVEVRTKETNSSENHLLLTPSDLTISFLEYSDIGSYDFSQFIPYTNDAYKQMFFPDTPNWAQANDGNDMHLDEDFSESGIPRWMIQNSSKDLWLERLSNGENGGRKRYIEFGEKCPDGYKVGIRIGAVMIYRGVFAPFHEDNWPMERYKCLQSQHPKYYSKAYYRGYNSTEDFMGRLITTVEMTDVIHKMNYYYSIDGQEYGSEKKYINIDDGMLYEIDENNNRVPVNMEELNNKLYDKKLILPELYYYKE
jgi:superfamily I DNA/RNA helicase